MKVIITGATGFIGRALVPALRDYGDDVIVLSRDGERAGKQLGVRAVQADLEQPGAWTEVLAGAGAIVHLAGESVAGKRWDARQKQVIRDSRVESTRVLVEAIEKLGERPGVFACSSGVDYYGYASGPLDDDEVTEIDPPADTFLGRVCREWEKEAFAAERLGLRVVVMRTGLVLGNGGPLAQMTAPFKLFVGGKLGNGKQWVSWIHLADAVAAYVAAVHDTRYRGAINLVTGSVRNRDLAKLVGKAMHRPSWLPAPGFALKAAVGEFAEVILNGRMVVPTRLRELGFTWKHPELDEALHSALEHR